MNYGLYLKILELVKPAANTLFGRSITGLNVSECKVVLTRSELCPDLHRSHVDPDESGGSGD